MPITPTSVAFPFESMAIGDSFFIATTLEPMSTMARIRSRFRYWGLKQCPRSPMRIAVRRVEDGVRCWRVA